MWWNCRKVSKVSIIPTAVYLLFPACRNSLKYSIVYELSWHYSRLQFACQGLRKLLRGNIIIISLNIFSIFSHSFSHNVHLTSEYWPTFLQRRIKGGGGGARQISWWSCLSSVKSSILRNNGWQRWSLQWHRLWGDQWGNWTGPRWDQVPQGVI